ncbi:hypothetical protein J6590_079773 [Homalodisca vitripennis]|nr:hypothetical protein J6590_079773 [Homalodisca vitripennis]
MYIARFLSHYRITFLNRLAVLARHALVVQTRGVGTCSHPPTIHFRSHPPSTSGSVRHWSVTETPSNGKPQPLSSELTKRQSCERNGPRRAVVKDNLFRSGDFRRAQSSSLMAG